jgi:hypothetical protein
LRKINFLRCISIIWLCYEKVVSTRKPHTHVDWKSNCHHYIGSIIIDDDNELYVGCVVSCVCVVLALEIETYTEHRDAYQQWLPRQRCYLLYIDIHLIVVSQHARELESVLRQCVRATCQFHSAGWKWKFVNLLRGELISFFYVGLWKLLTMICHMAYQLRFVVNPSFWLSSILIHTFFVCVWI